MYFQVKVPGKKKQGNVDVSKCEGAYRKVGITFQDSVNKRGTCGVCIYLLERSKQAVKDINSGQNHKKKSTKDIFRG